MIIYTGARGDSWIRKDRLVWVDGIDGAFTVRQWEPRVRLSEGATLFGRADNDVAQVLSGRLSKGSGRDKGRVDTLGVGDIERHPSMKRYFSAARCAISIDELLKSKLVIV